MATVSIAPLGSEYENAAIMSLKRPLDSYDSACKLPPAVKLKSIDPQPGCLVSTEPETKSSGDFSAPSIPVSTTEKSPTQPIRYGHRLIPQLIDEGAKNSPDVSFWSIPRSSNLADGFRDINYAQVAGAINRVAWWINENVGKSTNFESLAYMGPPDLRYAILTVAAQKTGHTAFFSSHWNTTETHLHLLESVKCQLFITTTTLSATVIPILAKRAMRVFVIPELDDLLFGPQVETYPYSKTFEEARHDPFVTCHTSGSTGFPKVVTATHGTLAGCDAFQDLPAKGHPATSVEAMRGKRVLAGVPPFHSAGLFIRLAMPVYYDVTAVEGPLTPLTAEVAHEMHTHGSINISILRPAVWEEIAETPDHLHQLSSLEYAMNTACAMPKELGDIISTKTSIMTFIGSTEAMLYPIHYPSQQENQNQTQNQTQNQKEWSYHSFHPCMSASLLPHHDDLYELIITRNPTYSAYQTIFFTFPSLHTYPTKDLYTPHPTTPNLWTYRGRSDDVIVLTSGKKMHPGLMEEIITSHPAIRSALVLGQTRLRTALLLEAKNPSASAEEHARLLDRVWATIERANGRYAEAVRIGRDYVMFTAPGKPMVRTSKGSVQRIDTVLAYRDEIDEFYDGVVGQEKEGEGSLVKDF